MLSSYECENKIADLTAQIKRYTEGTYVYEQEVPHLERLRKAYSLELSKALAREI